MLEAKRLLIGCVPLDFTNNEGKEVKGTILYVASPDDVNRVPSKVFVKSEIGKEILKEGLLDDNNLSEIIMEYDLKGDKVKYTGARLF